MEIKILGVSGIPHEASCTVLFAGQKCVIPNLAPEVAKPSIYISEQGLVTIRIVLEGSFISNVLFNSSIFPKSGKVWVPLFKEKNRKTSSLTTHSQQKMLIYVSASDKENQDSQLKLAKKEILAYKKQKSQLENSLRSKTQEFNRIKQELDMEIKSNTKLKRELKTRRSKIDSLFLDFIRTYKIEKLFVHVHPGLYKFEGKILSLSLSGQKLFCHIADEILQVKEFYEKFCVKKHKRSKTAEGSRKSEDLNKLIHNTVFSVRSKLPNK